MRRFAGRFAILTLAFLLFIVGVALSTRCSAALASGTRIGCHFDSQQRWEYVLIVESDPIAAKYMLRQPMSASFDPRDMEVHIAPAFTVRPGYCPDEQQKFMGRGVDVQRASQ